MGDKMKRTKDVLKIALDFCKKNKRYPTQVELIQLGITRSMVRESFRSLEGLHAHIAQQRPDLIFNLAYAKQQPIKKTNVAVITTAVTESTVDVKFLKNLETFCKEKNGQLLILPSLITGKSQYTLDPILADKCIVFEEVNLRSSFTILGLRNTARTVDPTTGLPRAGQRGGSVVAASPKQRLKYVATGIDKLPNALMTTGAITKPNYSVKHLQKDKGSYLAELDHVMGAIIVEFDGDTYHFRQIQADEDGSFIDLNRQYKNGKSKKVSSEALVMGDWHVGDTSPLAREASIEQIKYLLPRYVILHDVADFLSINHHVIGKEITLGQFADKAKLSLKEDLKSIVKELTTLSKLTDNLVIVKSNHDEFLDRYLNEGRYLKDSHNHILALELALAMAKGEDPLRYGLEMFGLNINNIIWLKRDESFKVFDIECGAHGDKGSGGQKGSVNAMEQAYLKSVSGHTHTPEIMRGVYVVGTNTATNPHYGVGPSSWMNTNCNLTKNGCRQLINSIKGSWKR